MGVCCSCCAAKSRRHEYAPIGGDAPFARQYAPADLTGEHIAGAVYESTAFSPALKRPHAAYAVDSDSDSGSGVRNGCWSDGDNDSDGDAHKDDNGGGRDHDDDDVETTDPTQHLGLADPTKPTRHGSPSSIKRSPWKVGHIRTLTVDDGVSRENPAPCPVLGGLTACDAVADEPCTVAWTSNESECKSAHHSETGTEPNEAPDTAPKAPSPCAAPVETSLPDIVSATDNVEPVSPRRRLPLVEYPNVHGLVDSVPSSDTSPADAGAAASETQRVHGVLHAPCDPGSASYIVGSCASDPHTAPESISAAANVALVHQPRIEMGKEQDGAQDCREPTGDDADPAHAVGLAPDDPIEDARPL